MLALWLFPRAFNQQSVAISGGIFLFTLLLAAYAFPRVIGEASSQLQRLVGGDRFAKLDKLRLFSEQLRRHIDVRSMAEELEPILIAAFSLRGFHLVCADDSGRGFTAAYAYPADREIVVSDLNQKSAVFECFRLTGLKWLTSTDETTDGPQLPAVDEARAKLRMWGGQLLVPFTADNAMLGFLMLQRERHEQPFTGPEMDQLLQLCGEIGLMLHQIGMKNEILLNRELDLLGRMSRGMAHDLNNLTVPISTLLQLVNEGADQGILRTDLLPVAMRNLQTMRNYIKEALFFSENLRPQIARTNLGNTVRGLAEVVQASTRSRKQIVVETNNPGDVMADIDEVLIQRLLTNLITNAIDASPEGATVKVELTETVFNKRGDVKEGSSWAYIRVIDRGHGIHREHLNRIFTPYFTTKNSGDEERGFGLGLAICRKIAKLHHGSLSVQSELGKGTVITLELPCSQESVITDFRKTA
jgi:signal transduction histidine kinase